MKRVPARLNAKRELSIMTLGSYIPAAANRFAVFIGHPDNTSEDFQLFVGMFWINGRLIGPIVLDKTAFVAHPEFPDELKGNCFLDSEVYQAQKDCAKAIDRIAGM